MRTAEGQVVDGKVVLVGERLRDGASVTVLIDDDPPPALTDADVDELRASQTSVRSGEYLTADEVFDQIRRKRK
jgi:hypothetical protein